MKTMKNENENTTKKLMPMLAGRRQCTAHRRAGCVCVCVCVCVRDGFLAAVSYCTYFARIPLHT